VTAFPVVSKPFTVQFESDAQADISDAFEWYELQSFGLGGEFLRSLAAATERLEQSAMAYPDIGRGFRKILLRRFPYGLHYEVMGGKVVSVLACLHQRRDPAVWPGMTD
jgi:plasmid stabilization system protein ParE